MSKIELHKAENPSKPRPLISLPQQTHALDDKTEQFVKKMKTILYKLTPDNCEKLAKQASDLLEESEKQFNCVIDLVFEKAIDVPYFSATLSRCLALKKFSIGTKHTDYISFSKLLVIKCQSEFEKIVFAKIATSNSIIEKKNYMKRRECEDAERNLKRKALGIIRFIGELFKVHMLTASVMHDYIKKLFNLGDDDSLQCLCTLLTIIGKNMDSNKSKSNNTEYTNKDKMNIYFRLLQEIVNERQTSARVRYMLKDVIDLRNNGWVSTAFRSNVIGEDGFIRIDLRNSINAHKLKVNVDDFIQLGPGGRNVVGGSRGSSGGSRTSNQEPERKSSTPANRFQALASKTNPRIEDLRRGVSRNQPSASRDCSKVRGNQISTPAQRGATEMKKQKNKKNKTYLNRKGDSKEGRDRDAFVDKEAVNADNVITQVHQHRKNIVDWNWNYSEKGYYPRNSSQVMTNKREDEVKNSLRTLSSSAIQLQRTRAKAIATVKSLNVTVKPRKPCRNFNLSSEQLKAELDAGGETGRIQVDSSREGSTTREEKKDVALRGNPDLTELEIEKRAKALLDEFLHNTDFQEAILCVSEICAPTTISFFVTYAFNCVLERSAQTRQQIGQLMHDLIKAKVMTAEQYIKGLQAILSLAEDYAIDIPHIWEYLGELIAPLIKDGTLPMSFLQEAAQPCFETGCGGLFVSAVLHAVSKKLGTHEVGELWRTSNLQWSQFLSPNTNTEEFIEENKLEFTDVRLNKSDNAWKPTYKFGKDTDIETLKTEITVSVGSPSAEEERKVAEKNEENTKVDQDFERNEVIDVIDQPVTKSQTVPKYNYKEDQWSPLNPEGKRQYDRTFLLRMQTQPMSLRKPEGLPDLEVIKDSATVWNNKTKQYERTVRVSGFQQRGHIPNFIPGYVKSSSTPRSAQVTQRTSQQGGKTEQKMKSIVFSFNQDVRLNKSDNAWKPTCKFGKDTDTETLKTEDLYKKVRGILNKLTPQKFQTLVNQANDLLIDTEERLKGVIDLVFEKALDEPNFSDAYANLCKRLAMKKVPVGNKDNNFVNFRKLLLNKCQKEFERDTADDVARIKRAKEQHPDDEVKKRELDEELEDLERKAKRRSLGNIRFIGELFKLHMLTARIMHDCLKKLLNQEDEDSLECLCRLLTTIGKDMDSKKGKSNNKKPEDKMNGYFRQMQEIVKKRQTSLRVRFMLQDVMDLRQNNWILRRDENNPKTLNQIHLEAEREAIEREMSLTRSQSHRRSNMGGGGSSVIGEDA